MKTKVLALVYFLTGILFIAFESSPLPALILKALIIPLLMALFLVNIRLADNRLHIMLLAGLFFSWTGDVILEIPNSIGDLFIPGLVCFLLAHVMYLSVFLITGGENVIFGKRPYLLTPVIVYGAILIWYLYDGLGPMRLPVILYALVILSMLAGAVNLFGKVSRMSYRMILAGAILFVISDSTIAINKFHHHFEAASVAVMVTYLAAQFLIVTGYIREYVR
jgi:uncharacterized membrane protein YhhN